MISIHVPREGDDGHTPGNLQRPRKISIHVPREGDDFFWGGQDMEIFLFQSTSPVRGTTTCSAMECWCSVISIHVPREGDDW